VKQSPDRTAPSRCRPSTSREMDVILSWRAGDHLACWRWSPRPLMCRRFLYRLNRWYCHGQRAQQGAIQHIDDQHSRRAGGGARSVIVAGFQGMSRAILPPSGRGGSTPPVVALGAALKADGVPDLYRCRRCVHTGPGGGREAPDGWTKILSRKCSKWPPGSKVLQIRSVEFRRQITMCRCGVLHSFSRRGPGP